MFLYKYLVLRLLTLILFKLYDTPMTWPVQLGTGIVTLIIILAEDLAEWKNS